MQLPPLHVEGNKFVDANGLNFKYVGVSDFDLFRRSQLPNGYAALVAPRLAEWKNLSNAGGFMRPLVVRTFRFAAKPNAFAMDPWSYEFKDPAAETGSMPAVTEFCNYLGERGFYVDFTAGDAQFVLPNIDGPRGQNQHQNEFMAALVPTTNAFFQTCNEPYKNGIDVTKVIPPRFGDTLRSSGAFGDHAEDFFPVLDFIDFHSNRDTGAYYWPKWVYDLPTSASVIMGQFPVPMILGEPMGADETNQPGHRSSTPEYFGRLGALVGWALGVTFHSQNGTDGNHLGPIQSDCAAKFFEGIKGTLA